MTDNEKEIYNKAIDDVLETAKGYGLISSEVGFSDVMAYELQIHSLSWYRTSRSKSSES